MTTADRYLLTNEERQRLATVDALLALGDAATRELVEMLREPSWTVRRSVIAALSTLGAAAANALVAALETQRDNEDAIAGAVDAMVGIKEVPQGLLERLARNPDAAVAADAAQILGRRRDPAGLDLLIELVDHSDDNVAVAAIEGLGRMGAAAASVDVLRRVVHSGNFFRTFPAIDVLGRSQDPRAVDALAALVEEAPYAPEAIRALGRTADPRAVAVLGRVLLNPSNALVRGAAVALEELRRAHRQRFDKEKPIDEALGRLARKELARGRLEQALPEADIAERLAIVHALGALGSPAAEPCLRVLLASGDADVARAAARAIKNIEASAERELVVALAEGNSVQRLAILPLLMDADSAEEVRKCIADEDPEVRVAACQALARFADETSLPQLFHLLGDDNAKVALVALSTIQAIGGKQVERLALVAVESERPEIRRSALRILGYFGFAAALPAVLKACDDEDPRVRDAAISSLAFIEAPEARLQLFKCARSAEAAARASAMRTLGLVNEPRAHAELARGLEDADAWVRYHACQSVGKLRLRAATPKVRELLSDAMGQVRVAAVEALARMPGSEPMEALAEVARSGDLDMRRAALVGLGLSANVEARGHLLHALRSDDAPTRMMAIAGIAQLPGEDVVEAVLEACGDSDEAVRMAAVGALGATGTHRSVDALLQLLERAKTDEERDRIRIALAVPADNRADGLVERLEDASLTRAQEIVGALVRLPHRAGERALLRAMKFTRPEIRKVVAPALAAMGTRAAHVALVAAAEQDSDEAVREVAALAVNAP